MLKDRIINEVRAITGRECYYVSSQKIEADKLLGNAKLPCVFLIITGGEGVVQRGGQYVEQAEVTLVFAEATSYTASDERNTGKVMAEQALAVRFVSELRASARWGAVELLASREFYDGSIYLATGWAVNLRLQDLYGYCAEGGGEYSREIDITSNGTYDVTAYDKANVNVQGLWIESDKLVLDVESEVGKIILTEK